MIIKNKGFTLIELIVVIAIIAVLSGVILFSITQYINRGKDSNISGNLAILIPAGEVFYGGNGNSYNDGSADFCEPEDNSVLKNIIAQMPKNPSEDCLDGICCNSTGQAWVACAREFTDPDKAFCVDSRGMKKEIDNGQCAKDISVNGVPQCP